MEKWKIDVPVFMLFFNRPDTLEKVFESVKKAKPSKLFLTCDGPREGRKDDIENVEKCKAIVENIDWECEVHKNYSDVNLGCGMRMYSGLKWAFEYVDRIIVVEDDCVLHQDFYKFSEELLEKYKDDERIFMISAMNHVGKYNKNGCDYFFGPVCCWGWATWRRAFKDYDFEMTFLNDEYSMKCVQKRYFYYNDAIKAGRKKMQEYKTKKKLSSWTYQNGMLCALNNQTSIIPSVNLVENIGLSGDAGHSMQDIRTVPKSLRCVYYAKTYPLEFPLKHPKYVVEDHEYPKLANKILGHGFFRSKARILESVIRRFIYAKKGERTKLIKKLFFRK